ncbi:MAG: hypothetical protein GW789_16520 [Ignavibacteria bacterium]|nr:hypothetical protein [Ignavibacteria bacterium]
MKVEIVNESLHQYAAKMNEVILILNYQNLTPFFFFLTPSKNYTLIFGGY